MITEIRKSRLRRLWNQGLNITQCARKCKMDPKTASRILKGEVSVNPNFYEVSGTEPLRIGFHFHLNISSC